MRKITLALACIIGIFTLVACGKNDNFSDASNSAPELIRIGTQTLADPEGIVKAEKWLEEEMGVPIEIITFDGGRDVNVAMASGEIDFGLLGSVPAALAIANGVDCKVIYIQSVLGDIESLMINPESGIANADDLKGKTIATVFSSTSHYSLLKYLEYCGVAPNEVDIIDMNASAIVAAYTRGDIDGAFIWDPQVTELEKLGAVRLASAKDLAEYGYATMDVEIVSTSFAEKYPEYVEKYVELMEKAVDMYRDDENAAGQSLARNLGIDADACIDQVRSSIWLSVQEQKTNQWFGNDELAEMLYETAVFLYDQGDVQSEPAMENFRNAVSSQYL